MKNSKLVKHQVKEFTKTSVMVDGEKVDIKATVRYDDRCGNGHNTFSITGEYYYAGKSHTDRNMISCGCVHEAISQAFPELREYLKWHLCSSDCPMHYIANTTYHAREHGVQKGWLYRSMDDKCLQYGDISEIKPITNIPYKGFSYIKEDEKTAKTASLEAARSCAIWPDASIDQLRDENTLKDRLPALMGEFQEAVESLGFEY